MANDRSEEFPDLGRQQEQIVRLGILQSQLREALRTRLSEDPETPNVSVLARNLGVGSGTLYEFLSGTMAVCSGKVLAAITAYVERPDLAEEITAASEPLSDRMCGASVFPKEVISFVTSVRIIHEAFVGTLTMEQFAELCEPHRALIEGLLNWSASALREVQKNPQVREVLHQTLCSPDFPKRAEAILERLEDKAARLERLFEQLQGRYALKKELAAALRVSMDSVRGVQKRNVGEEILDTMLARAQALLSSPVDSSLSSAPPGEAALAQLLDRFGGVDSPLGVHFTLGRESFRALQADPSDAAIEQVCRVVETARGLINVLAQLKSNAVSSPSWKRLGDELAELDLALRLFSVAHPNDLTPLHDAQRQTWALRRGKTTGRKD